MQSYPNYNNTDDRRLFCEP